MGYPKKHRGRRKIGSKKEEPEKKQKEIICFKMELKTQIKKLSLWIFVIPFITVNLCLFVSTNYQIFDNTFLSAYQIGRSQPTFPYFDAVYL